MTEAEASNRVEVAENFGVEMRFFFFGFKVLGARVRAGGSGSSREGMGPKEQVDMPETR